MEYRSIAAQVRANTTRLEDSAASASPLKKTQTDEPFLLDYLGASTKVDLHFGNVTLITLCTILEFPQ